MLSVGAFRCRRGSLFQSAIGNPQSAIVTCASRLSLLPVSSAFADVLRRGDAGAGTAGFRA